LYQNSIKIFLCLKKASKRDPHAESKDFAISLNPKKLHAEHD